MCHACRYFSARDPSLVNGSSCIGVATASTPAGPFNSSSSEALTCNEAMGGMIDPSPFVDTDGSVYLLYKVGRVLERLHLLSRLIASGDTAIAHQLACTAECLVSARLAPSSADTRHVGPGQATPQLPWAPHLHAHGL